MGSEETRKIVPTHVITSSQDVPLVDAVETMRRNNISCLLVTRGDMPAGILTERDLARFLERVGGEVEGYQVRDVMSAAVVTISESEDLFAAYSLMCGKNIRHLVVVDDQGRAVGIKTFSDLMRRLGEEYLSEIKTVGEVMTRDVLTMQPDQSIREALRVMGHRGVSCVLVVEGDVPVGILTERDLARLVAFDRSAGARVVREVMSSPVSSIGPGDYAFEAVARMESLGVRHQAVTDEAGRLLGLITQTDLVASLVKRYAALEFMVRKRTRQLVRKNEELEYSNQQLRHLDEMKSAFLSSVSHELRTPLTSLLGFAKITGRIFSERFAPLAGDTPSLRKFSQRICRNLEVMTQEGERMTRLINDFLDLTKIEAGRVEWRDKLIPVTDFVLHACHAVRGQFEAKPEVELRSHVAEMLPQVYVDVDRMLQVMVNLLSNAAKFTDKGAVTVTAVGIDDEFVEIRVTDTGQGIPAQSLQKVFDKFHQIEQLGTDTHAEGTGLGLAICKEIIQHYGGRIWVESEPGKGSCFKFRLPASKPSRDSREDILTGLPTDGGDEADPLILAVDDSPGIRDYLEQLFRDDGFRIVTVGDGLTALKAAEEMLPRCIVMDLMMPGMEGSEAIRRLRENPATENIPVVVLSAYPYRSHAGGDVALPKPVDEEQLLQAVRGLIRGGRIKGRKCILVPNPKGHGNMLMISAGKLRYIRPEELQVNMTHRFSGTMFLSGGSRDHLTLKKLSEIDDVVVMILPEDEAE
ncbi:CBS domain-containing protein [Desulfolutivibrio sulfoxidireducens]|uniref:CBS domain-containing protein n=1 Tax=Desulfolutivibrio sulfoxidireducens TaxID=2773299 RepID=UPI00159D3CBC|nr:CBS domain-containing protein [Desulfolutivibrio sulfoxidireducens]QLA16601.1 CBS domain-containing protein [Desulfolutivibrio sulfoxidireducens]